MKRLGPRKNDAAEMATIEYIGNAKELKEKEERKKAMRDSGQTSYWEFSRNIAEEEIEYYDRAIAEWKEKNRVAMQPGNIKKRFEGKAANQYANMCRKNMEILRQKKKWAELDLQVLEKSKDHRMFRNADDRYGIGINSLL